MDPAAGASPGVAIPQDSLLTVIRENVDGMLVIARDGVILLANPAAERLLGRPSTRLDGTRFGAPLVLEQATEIDLLPGGSPRTAEMRVVQIDWHGRPERLNLRVLVVLCEILDCEPGELVRRTSVTAPVVKEPASGRTVSKDLRPKPVQLKRPGAES